jgi:hypothetical protein
METGLRAVHVPLVAKKPENTPLPNVEILTRLFEIKLDFPFYFSFFTAGAPYNPATPSTKPAQQFGAPPSAISSSGSPSSANLECEL